MITSVAGDCGGGGGCTGSPGGTASSQGISPDICKNLCSSDTYLPLPNPGCVDYCSGKADFTSPTTCVAIDPL